MEKFKNNLKKLASTSTSTSTSSTAGEKKNQNQSQNQSPCVVCGLETEKTCGPCKSVSYCSKEHQRQDWKAHKKSCSPFIIQETETRGKEWIATRDLPADTILLEEFPVLFAPDSSYYDSSCCVTCGMSVLMMSTGNKNRKCSSCSWPICSEKCEESSIHAENECQFFSAHNMKFHASTGTGTGITNGNGYGFQILMIRASGLKRKDGKLFEKIMEFQDFYVIPHAQINLCAEHISRLKNHHQFIRRLGNLTKEECFKLSKILQVNSFAIHQRINGQLLRHLQMLYPQSSRMNHSCTPNCIYSSGPPLDFQVRVRTAVPVKKGESLTISYLDPMQMLQPTSSRQQFLVENLGFICKCERCLDPTELGTFLSGIKCQKSTCRGSSKSGKAVGFGFRNLDLDVGYFLPENPVDSSFDSGSAAESVSVNFNSWFKCNGCGEKKRFSVLKSSLPLEIQRAFDLDLDGSEKVENSEAFLATHDFKTGGKYLHKNNFLIHNLVKKNLFPLPIALLNQVGLEQEIRRLEYLVRIHDTLFPGLSHSKSTLLLKLAETASCLLEKFVDQLSFAAERKLVETAGACYKRGMEYSKNDNSGDSQSLLQHQQPDVDDDVDEIEDEFGHWTDLFF